MTANEVAIVVGAGQGLGAALCRRFVKAGMLVAAATRDKERVTAVADRDGVKYSFGSRGWLLHRLSGTEPMVRLYCEHEEAAKMEEILEEAETRLREFAGRGSRV